jgi:hypothetical protein
MSAHPTKLELGKTILRLAGRQATPGLIFIGGAMIVSSGEDRIRRTPEEGIDLQRQGIPMGSGIMGIWSIRSSGL